ncbi:MAG: hypothetical protein IKN04_05165 [Clostridia bacterium]|nr:hypothetical protein [Clostridia bacterium]
MKKGLKILCLIVALIAVFLLGWRVMPNIWPGIKEAVVYPVMPQLKPTPAPTQEPYQPKSTAAFGDPIAATDSLIYYFYKDYCPWCRQLEPLTAGLPETITLPDGTQSAVKLVCLNKVEEPMLQVITAYYEQYGVPEEEQYVPAIVIGGRYLFTYNEIVPQLMEALTAGEGLTTPLLNGAERTN